MHKNNYQETIFELLDELLIRRKIAEGVIETDLTTDVFSRANVLEKNMLKVIPLFAYCPTKNAEFNKIPLGKLTALDLAVKTKIIGYCKLRQR